MASNVVVVDSAMKRTLIKVGPGKYMREVLEEACKSRKLDPESYSLKTQSNKTVDLSQPFRLSGLSAGAKLQLTQASRSASVVDVAIHLPESEGGGRVSDKFPSTTSLWQVLRKFEDGAAGQPPKKYNLTQRGALPTITSGAGRLEYEQPVLNAMGRNLETFQDLQKTLAQLGYSRSVSMRLSFKNTGQPLEEAMKEIGQYFSSLDAGSATTEAESVIDVAPMPVALDSTAQDSQDTQAAASTLWPDSVTGSEDVNPDTAMSESVVANQITEPSEVAQPPTSELQLSVAEPTTAATPSNVVNGISVFRAPSSNTPVAALQPDDPSTFEPSIEHAKAHQAALQRASKNQRLLSDKELEAQEAERQAKLALVQSVAVRVRYPDQSMIETEIQATETSSDLYAKVMGTLAAAPEPFELRFSGAKGHQTLPESSNARLVKDFGFRGKVLVTMVWSQHASAQARKAPCLKEEYRSKAQDLKVELSTQRSHGEENHKAAMAKPENKSNSSGAKGDLEAKMKKFLGFGKR